MSAPSGPSSDLTARVEQYLDERRRLGFKLCSPGHALRNFERFVTDTGHAGPLTVDMMAQWARQVQPRYMVDGQANSGTAARRLAALGRGYLRWAELVLVMEGHHRDALGDIDPTVRGKTFLLGHWQKQEVPDPYKRSRAVWDESVKLIDEGVAAWLKRL